MQLNEACERSRSFLAEGRLFWGCCRKSWEIRRKFISAHRASWELHYGKIPDGMHVLHSCDNRACVRPEHLFLGNHQENMIDRDRKGRGASGSRNGRSTHPERTQRGERSGRAKLRWKQVLEIREIASHAPLRGFKSDLARRFGVDHSVIRRIIRGEIWKAKE